MTKKLTDHDLLVRIDERQRGIAKKVSSLCGSLKKKVDNDEDYKEMEIKVNKLWDSKNQFIGWLIGSAGIGGVAGALANQLKEVFAR